jgi:hypothetical protein
MFVPSITVFVIPIMAGMGKIVMRRISKNNPNFVEIHNLVPLGSVEIKVMVCCNHHQDTEKNAAWELTAYIYESEKDDTEFLDNNQLAQKIHNPMIAAHVKVPQNTVTKFRDLVRVYREPFDPRTRPRDARPIRRDREGHCTSREVKPRREENRL